MQAVHCVSLSHQARDRSGRRWDDLLQPHLSQLVAALLLLLVSPLMLAVTFLIWRSDGAPVLFAHYRVGRNGRLFRCFQFRTMYTDSQRLLDELLQRDAAARAAWQRVQKLADVPRVTPVGRFLRRTSLDELPQLITVLRGEMSLVGPRPITVAELTRYGRVRWDYLSVAPGITGLWQVSGRNNTSYAHRVKLDEHYIEDRSLRLDLWILLRTVKVVLLRDGAM